MARFCCFGLRVIEWTAHWTTRRVHLQCYTGLEWTAHYRRCVQHTQGLDKALPPAHSPICAKYSMQGCPMASRGMNVQIELEATA
ncbi:unnamed protein product [Victoria cruziana]